MCATASFSAISNSKSASWNSNSFYTAQKRLCLGSHDVSVCLTNRCVFIVVLVLASCDMRITSL